MTTTRLDVRVRERGDVAIVDLAGDIDSGADSALEAAYAQAAQAGTRAILLNFAQVGYVNSTGIALIVGLLAKARRDRVAVRCTGLSDHYREIFEITRLADFMRIADNEDGAVRGAEGSKHA